MAGSPSSSEPSGTRRRTLYCTGSTLATRSWAITKSIMSTRSSTVVHGVKGSQEGRTLDAMGAKGDHGPRGVGGGVPLVQTFEGGVVDRLEGGHHEGAAGRSQLGHGVGLAEEVLDFDRGVEGDFGVPAVDASDDASGVVGEVGAGEADVAGAGGDEVVDVGEYRVLVHGADRPS